MHDNDLQSTGVVKSETRSNENKTIMLKQNDQLNGKKAVSLQPWNSLKKTVNMETQIKNK